MLWCDPFPAAGSIVNLSFFVWSAHALHARPLGPSHPSISSTASLLDSFGLMLFSFPQSLVSRSPFDEAEPPDLVRRLLRQFEFSPLLTSRYAFYLGLVPFPGAVPKAGFSFPMPLFRGLPRLIGLPLLSPPSMKGSRRLLRVSLGALTFPSSALLSRRVPPLVKCAAYLSTFLLDPRYHSRMSLLGQSASWGRLHVFFVLMRPPWLPFSRLVLGSETFFSRVVSDTWLFP